MNTVGTEPAHRRESKRPIGGGHRAMHDAGNERPARASGSGSRGRPHRSLPGPARCWLLALARPVCLRTGAFTYGSRLDRARHDAERLLSYVQQHERTARAPAGCPSPKPPERRPPPPWDGFVRITIEDAKTIGLLVVYGPAAGRADQAAADGPHRLRPEHPVQDPPEIRYARRKGPGREGPKGQRRESRWSICLVPSSRRPRTTSRPPTSSGSTTKGC